MTVNEIKNKFPEAAKKTDEELEQYRMASEILTDLCLNAFKKKLTTSS